MTTEQQIKALAELDGLEQFNKDVCPDILLEVLPPYLTSYDAIIPLIQKQSMTVKQSIHRIVFELIAFGSHRFDVTPAQLCEALLRATGKWEE